MDKNYNLNNILSTGNGLKDALIGGIAGGADALNPRGEYYVRANYKGRGLADTGIGYMANPDYRSFADGVQMLGSLFKRNKGNVSSNSILAKLSALMNKNQGGAPYTLQGELKNPPYANYGVYSLPYQNEGMPNISFNYRQDRNVQPDNRIFGGYNLPTQSYGTLDFNRWK